VAKHQKGFTPALLPQRVGRAFALLTKTYHGSPVIRRAEGYKRAIAESGLNLVSDYLIAEPKGDVETKRHGAEAMPKS